MSNQQATDRTPLTSQNSSPMAENDRTTDPNAPITNNNNTEQPAVPEQTALIFSIIMIGISSGVAVGTNLWLSCIIAFGINWLVFAVYAWPFHTEKIYDFTGMITFLSVDLFSFIYYNARYKTFDHPRSIIMFLMPLVWTLRLGMLLCFIFFLYFFTHLAFFICVFVYLPKYRFF